MVNHRWLFGVLIWTAAALVASPNLGAAADTGLVPVLCAKLEGKVGSGKVVIGVSSTGLKGLGVEVNGLTAQAGKTVGVAFKIAGAEPVGVGKITLDKNGHGVLTTDKFPEVHPGDLCGVLEDSTSHAVLLSGKFQMPIPVLGTKLEGKAGTGGNAVVAAFPDGKKTLRVEVNGLTSQAGKTVGVAFKIGTAESVPVGRITVDKNGHGVLIAGKFPEAHAGDVCEVLEDSLSHAVLLHGKFQLPPK